MVNSKITEKPKNFETKDLDSSRILDAIDQFSGDITPSERKWTYVSGAWAGLKSLAFYTAIEVGVGLALRKWMNVGKVAEMTAETAKVSESTLRTVGRYIKENPISMGLVGAVAMYDGYSGTVEAQENLRNEKDAAIGRGVRELRHRGEVTTHEGHKSREVFGKFSERIVNESAEPHHEPSR